MSMFISKWEAIGLAIRSLFEKALIFVALTASCIALGAVLGLLAESFL